MKNVSLSHSNNKYALSKLLTCIAAFLYAVNASIVLPATCLSYPSRLDTIKNIAVSSIFGTIVTSHNGSLFIAVDQGVRHSIRTFDAPFKIEQEVITGSVPGSEKESVPVGFLRNGDVIVSSGYTRDILQSRTPGSADANWSAKGYHDPVMRSGCDVIIARTDTDSGDMWVHIEANPLRYTPMFPATGRVEILGQGKYVVLKQDSSILIYNTETRKNEPTLFLPNEILGYEQLNEIGVDQTDPGSPSLMIVNSKSDSIKCITIRNGHIPPGISIDGHNCDLMRIWYNNSSDTIVQLCAPTLSATEVRIIVYSIEQNHLRQLWTNVVPEKATDEIL